MAVDMLRRCYSTAMQFGTDPAQTATIQWYECAPGALDFPYPTVFASGNWASDKAWWPGPGEVLGAARPWKEPTIAILPAGLGPPCGDPEDYLSGFAVPNPPPLPRNDTGLAMCCGGLVSPLGEPVILLRPACSLAYTMTGGLRLSGSAIAGNKRVGTGGLTLGGSAIVARTIAGTGGLRLGGSVSLPIFISGTGGLTLGGSALAGRNQVGTGGLTLGGSALAGRNQVGTGGLTLGGSALAGRRFQGTGGLTLGGSALAGRNQAGTGGLTLGGTAKIATAKSGTGGLTLGGTAIIGAGITGTGGLTLGGTATIAAAISGSGGLTLGGTALTGKGIKGTGGLTLGGTAGVTTHGSFSSSTPGTYTIGPFPFPVTITYEVVGPGGNGGIRGGVPP